MSRYSSEALLQSEASQLLKSLVDSHDPKYGFGTMSSAVYDTAWVSMLAKPGFAGEWLFPECFQYLLSKQRADGGWDSYGSEIDGIMNSLAALLAIKRHSVHANETDQVDLHTRIANATTYLTKVLASWDVSSTMHVGFEYIVPALLNQLEKDDIYFQFGGRVVLDGLNQKKMSKFRPEMLYGTYALTALHSLEAFIGVIDFDKVKHHKVFSSMMASPSSTAAYLMHVSEWDREAEEYLRVVVSQGEGRGSGGVPSAFPSTLFELTWVMSTLLENGFSKSDFEEQSLQKAMEVLESTFQTQNGLIGFG
jgi:hypothetical protein